MMVQVIHANSTDEIYSFFSVCGNDLHNQKLNNPTDLVRLSEKLGKYGNVLAVRMNNEIAGMACFYSNDKKTKIGFLSIIVIRAKYQRRGLGQVLLEAVMDACKYVGMDILRLEVAADNMGAQKFYLKNGFRLVEEDDAGTLYFEKQLANESRCIAKDEPKTDDNIGDI